MEQHGSATHPLDAISTVAQNDSNPLEFTGRHCRWDQSCASRKFLRHPTATYKRAASHLYYPKDMSSLPRSAKAQRQYHRRVVPCPPFCLSNPYVTLRKTPALVLRSFSDLRAIVHPARYSLVSVGPKEMTNNQMNLLPKDPTNPASHAEKRDII